MPKHRKPKSNDITLNIPNWAGKLYVILGVCLLPWIIYLSLTLPTHHRTTNWDVIWTGFDIGLLIALVSTGIAAYTRSIYVVIAAAASGTLLLVDAWFDVISEQSHTGFTEAVVLAFVVEIPLAFMSFYLASHALRQNTPARLTKKAG